MVKSRLASHEQNPLDIFVGGGGDRLFRCARRYADDFAERHPERDVVYLPQGRRRVLSQLLVQGRKVNLIGHSWGAADVDWVLRKLGHNATLGLIVGVDPVGKPGRLLAPKELGADAVIRIMGTGSEGRLLDGNLSAKLGRMIGHVCPSTFLWDQADAIDAPFAHYDVRRMMQYAGEDGRTAEDRLLQA